VTFVRLLVATFVAGSIGMMLHRSLNWPGWSYYAICVVGLVFCYVVSASLTRAYIERRAPEFASNEEAVPGLQAWELTAGTGIVPKWVSWVGMLGMGFALAMPFELLARLLR
jgi:hypothetical protein